MLGQNSPAMARVGVGNWRLFGISLLVVTLSATLPEATSEILPIFIYLLLPVWMSYSDAREQDGVPWRAHLKEVFQWRPLPFATWLPLFAIVLLCVPVSTFLLNIAIALTGNQMDFLMEGALEGPAWFVYLTLAIIPAISEEALMRGFMRHHYQVFSPRVQMVYSGLLFAIFHMNFNQFGYTFFLGMVFFWAVYLTKSIWAAVFLHVINNALTLWMGGVGSPASMPEAAEAVEAAEAAIGPAEWVGMLLVALLALYLIVMCFRQLKKICPVLEKTDLEADSTDVSGINDAGGYAPWQRAWTWGLYLLCLEFVLFSILLHQMINNPMTG